MEYTISKVAERVGISTYTLRYYEKEGLLPEVKRNEKGIRIYDESDIVWIDLVKCLKETGMPIADIHTIVKLSLKGDQTIPTRKEILKKHKTQVQKQIEELNTYMKKIDYKIQWYEGKESSC